MLMKFGFCFMHFRVNVKSDLDIDLLTEMGTHQLQTTKQCSSSLVKIHAMSAKYCNNCA